MIAELLAFLLSTAPPPPRCVWEGTPFGQCFEGDIDTMPCDYPHPSEFSHADWARFRDRCRR